MQKHKYKLICPDKSLFSEEIYKIFPKNKIMINFNDLSDLNFLKIMNKFHIVLIRPNRFISLNDISTKTKIRVIATVSTGVNHIDKRIFHKKKN